MRCNEEAGMSNKAFTAKFVELADFAQNRKQISIQKIPAKSKSIKETTKLGKKGGGGNLLELLWKDGPTI